MGIVSKSLYSIPHSLHPSPEERNEALISALSDILWKLGARRERAIVALPPSHTQYTARVPSRSYTPDHLTERVIDRYAMRTCILVLIKSLSVLSSKAYMYIIITQFVYMYNSMCAYAHVHVYISYIYIVHTYIHVPCPKTCHFSDLHVLHTCIYMYVWLLQRGIASEIYVLFHRQSCTAFQTTQLWRSSLSHMCPR